MRIEEVHYFAVPNANNTNYYRLRVRAHTRLSVASFREGWFPATAVDALFGDVSEDSSGESLGAKLTLRGLYREAVVAVTKQWLNAAKNGEEEDAVLQGLHNARRRVLAYPSPNGEPYQNSVEVEYNPAKGVALQRAGEKLVFVLSANPDEVVGKIANFVQSEKTSLAIKQLGDLVSNKVSQASMSELALADASDLFGEMLRKQAEAGLAALSADTEDGEDGARLVAGKILAESAALLSLIDLIEESQ